MVNAEEMTYGTITRSATVNRIRSSEEALKAAGCIQYLNDEVVKTIPRCEGEIEAIFVKLGFYVRVSKLDEELAKLGFELIVDPVGLAAINEADPSFTDSHPNATQWIDGDGNYCYAVFGCWDNEHRKGVDHSGYSWYYRCWFPCRPIST